MAANFNNAAWFYDSLSRVVFGQALVNAQNYLLPYLKPNSNVLIVGGGTGWLLEELAKIHPSGLQITYVEVAPAMMALSQKRQVAQNQITFINNAVEDVILQQEFDAVISPFLFDNFRQDTLTKIFMHMHQSLKPGGIWLNTDFKPGGKWWQWALLNAMLLFFRLLCGIEATTLPAIEEQFINHSYRLMHQQMFYGRFIVTGLYQKPLV